MKNIRYLCVIWGFLALLASPRLAESATNLPPEAPTRLLMDLLSEPLSLESENPVMAWRMNSPNRSARQTAYQILVAESRTALAGGNGTVWDSGKILSSESSNVPYAGQRLEPDHAYYWKVRLWDEADRASPWSQPQLFTTAVKDHWLAKAIWGQSAPAENANNEFVFLRKSFDLPDKEITLALAHVTALSPEPANQYVYKLSMNGELVGAGPPRSYIKGKIIPAQNKPSTRTDDVMNRYNTFNVTPLLKPGQQNAVGALCYTAEDKRFLFQMKVFFADGTHQTIVSDPSWKALPAGNKVFANQGNITVLWYYAPREGIDARHFPFGWDDVGFDDSAWQAASVDTPITNLTASATLNTQSYLRAPHSIVKKGDGHYFIDFGKALLAGVRLDLKGADGQKVEIRLGEELSGPQTVRHQMRTGNTYQEVWTLKDGAQSLQNWGYRVFRYAELLNVPEPFSEANIRALELRQPFDDEASSFESSDPVLNDVWELCKYTIKALSLDMYVDTHTRERINYEGGIFPEQISDYTVHGEYAFPRFSIEHPYHRPAWCTEYKQLSVMMAWRDYLYTGNARSLEKHYDILKAKTLEKFINADFLVEKAIDAGGMHGPYGRDKVDWPRSELDGFQFTSINTVINAFNYKAVALLAEIARVLGKEQDAAHYSALAAKLRQAINTHLYDHEAGKFKDGKHTTHHSIHANAIPLSLGIVDPAYQDSVVDFITSRGMVGSVYLAQFLLDGLYLSGEADAALDLMTSDGLRSWVNMLKLNATLTGEAWDPSIKGNMSFSHPWATAPANVIPRGMFGIVPLEPGFAHFQIKPQPSSLEWAELTTPSIKGPISSRWERSADRLELAVSIPPNSRAAVSLPTLGTPAELLVIREGDSVIWANDKPAADLPEGIAFAQQEGGPGLDRRIALTVGAGSYRFTVKLLTPPDRLEADGSAEKVELEWSAGIGADAYSVRRSTRPGGPYTPIASGLRATAYSDTEVVDDQDYYYVVVPEFRSGVEGPSSPEARARIGLQPLRNGGFEAPSTSGFLYGPSDAGWTFAPLSGKNGSGVTANNSPFTAGNPPAPEGAQVAFLQGTASLSQPIRGLTPGTVYRIEFYGAQRKNRLDGGQTWDLRVDDKTIASFAPPATAIAYTSYQAEFTATRSSHTLSFVGTNKNGGDNTVFLDAVKLIPAEK